MAYYDPLIVGTTLNDVRDASFRAQEHQNLSAQQAAESRLRNNLAQAQLQQERMRNTSAENMSRNALIGSIINSMYGNQNQYGYQNMLAGGMMNQQNIANAEAATQFRNQTFNRMKELGKTDPKFKEMYPDVGPFGGGFGYQGNNPLIWQEANRATRDAFRDRIAPLDPNVRDTGIFAPLPPMSGAGVSNRQIPGGMNDFIFKAIQGIFPGMNIHSPGQSAPSAPAVPVPPISSGFPTATGNRRGTVTRRPDGTPIVTYDYGSRSGPGTAPVELPGSPPAAATTPEAPADGSYRWHDYFTGAPAIWELWKSITGPGSSGGAATSPPVPAPQYPSQPGRGYAPLGEEFIDDPVMGRIPKPFSPTVPSQDQFREAEKNLRQNRVIPFDPSTIRSTPPTGSIPGFYTPAYAGVSDFVPAGDPSNFASGDPRLTPIENQEIFNRTLRRNQLTGGNYPPAMSLDISPPVSGPVLPIDMGLNRYARTPPPIMPGVVSEYGVIPTTTVTGRPNIYPTNRPVEFDITKLPTQPEPYQITPWLTNNLVPNADAMYGPNYNRTTGAMTVPPRSGFLRSPGMVTGTPAQGAPPTLTLDPSRMNLIDTTLSETPEEMGLVLPSARTVGPTNFINTGIGETPAGMGPMSPLDLPTLEAAPFPPVMPRVVSEAPAVQRVVSETTSILPKMTVTGKRRGSKITKRLPLTRDRKIMGAPTPNEPFMRFGRQMVIPTLE